MLPEKTVGPTLSQSADSTKFHSNGVTMGSSVRGSRSKAELQELMQSLQRRKSALEASLKATADRGYLTLSPPPSPQSSSHLHERPPLSLRAPSPFTGGSLSVPPSPHRSERPLSPVQSQSRGRHQSQDSLLLLNSSESRLPNTTSSLLSMWNCSSCTTDIPSTSSRRGPSGAASMPSSPRLGRRLLFREGEPAVEPTLRQRKYSTGSLNGLGGHSRSLPRLYRGDAPMLSLPPRRTNKPRRSLPSLEKPPDVTVINTSVNPRRASLCSVGSAPCLDLGVGERRVAFGKAGLGSGMGQRRGSISSLSGKEELQDYHQRQRDERLREQEVERLERQRLETILCLCSELGRVETHPEVSAVSDLQKINHELEKLQVSDEESVFSDSAAPEGGFTSKGLSEVSSLVLRGVTRPQSPTTSVQSSANSLAPLLRSKVAEDVQLGQEVTRIEEERIQVLNNIEELEQKIRDLDTQMDESVREMEVERALLDGEQEAEVAQLQNDKEMLEQLNEKLGRMEKITKNGQTQDTEALEAETKRFEDLEFQQLEKESRQDEKKESETQQLLQEIAEYQRSVVTRKERLLTLKKQSTQITQQAQREKENFFKEKSNLIYMLQRERESLSSLERKYSELTGGRAFPLNPASMKHFRGQDERRRSNGCKEGGAIVSGSGLSRKRDTHSSGTIISIANRSLSPKVRPQTSRVGKV